MSVIRIFLAYFFQKHGSWSPHTILSTTHMKAQKIKTHYLFDDKLIKINTLKEVRTPKAFFLQIPKPSENNL